MAWNKYTRVVRLGIKQYLSVLKTEKSHAALCVSACSVGVGGGVWIIFIVDCLGSSFTICKHQVRTGSSTCH